MAKPTQTITGTHGTWWFIYRASVTLGEVASTETTPTTATVCSPCCQLEKIQKHPLPYRQTMKQLLTPGWETHQFIINTTFSKIDVARLWGHCWVVWNPCDLKSLWFKKTTVNWPCILYLEQIKEADGTSVSLLTLDHSQHKLQLKAWQCDLINPLCCTCLPACSTTVEKTLAM